MYKGKTVGVVVPAYNEEGLVGEVIDTLPTFVDRVYVVDDCSTDGTWAEITRHAAAANERREPAAPLTDGGHEGFVVPIRHERNRGAGGARKTGYARALADGMGVTVFVDADGQMDPTYMSRIIDPVVEGRVAYAKGTRLRDEMSWRGMSTWRLFGNLLLTFLTKVSSGYWGMTDSQNGYTAISYEALSAIEIDDLYEGYGFLNDVLTALNVRSMRIADVPHPARYGTERSGIRYSKFVPSLSTLLVRNFCHRLKTRYLTVDVHPLVVLYGLGTVGIAGGVLGGLTVLWTVVSQRLPSPFAPGSVTKPQANRPPDDDSDSDQNGTPDPTAGSTRMSNPTPYRAPRGSITRGAVALVTFLVGTIAASLAILFDVRSNADLEVRLDDPVPAAAEPGGGTKRDHATDVEPDGTTERDRTGSQTDRQRGDDR